MMTILNRNILLVFSLITCDQIVREACSALSLEQVTDLSEVLIFDSDPPSTNLPPVNISSDWLDPTNQLAVPDISENEAEKFLAGLGYNNIHPDEDESALFTRYGSDQELSLPDKIRIFQQDFGLPETGILDHDTKLTMGSPHCGTKRIKNKTTVMKWQKNTLTYRIRVRAAGAQPAFVGALVKRAFNEWSKVTNLNFDEKNDTNVDIEINFGDQLHPWRKQQCSFDNAKTMAHAYFPQQGDIHFNSRYFFKSGQPWDVFMDTAIHEIGHALGLQHSSSKGSIMHPTEMNRFTRPQPEDIKNIQALYGVRKGASTATKHAPKLCSLPKFDAVLDDVKGILYIFSGNYFYSTKEKLPIGRLISSKWPGITGPIDGAFRYVDGRTYFFKGSKYWRFRGSLLEPGHPRLISAGFPGLPDSVDAMYVDSRNAIVALKENRYWVYEPGRKQAASQYLKVKNIPSNVEAAVGTGGKVVMFKGKIMYQLVNGKLGAYKNPWMTCR